MFGIARPLDGLGRALGLAAVFLAVVGYARLQALAFRLRAREAKSRWASNLRDVVNLFAAALLFAGFVVTGAPVAAAFVFAGTTGVVLEAARHGGRSALGRPRVSLAAGLALALPIAALTPAATAALNRVASALFG